VLQVKRERVVRRRPSLVTRLLERLKRRNLLFI
jgi:hypothetical protein